MRNILALATLAPQQSVMPRPAIAREERLRATAELKRPGAMTSWRGRSGRRYVVGIYPLGGRGLPDIEGAVALAVKRTRDGEARVVGLAASDPAGTRLAGLRWLALTRLRGATELHLHLLAGSETERRAVLKDLGEA